MKAYIYSVNQETGDHTFEGEADTWDIFEGDERARRGAEHDLDHAGQHFCGGGAAQLFHLTTEPLPIIQEDHAHA